MSLRDDEQGLSELSDLDEAMIRHVAQAFIAQHGMRRITDGKLVSSASSESVASALYELLDNPLRGLRQVVPMIAMLSANLGLAFSDELYELELKKLSDRQRLADEIALAMNSGHAGVLRINVADLLSQLESREFVEAIPLIEAQLGSAGRGVAATQEEIMARIRRLWREYSDSEIVLNLSFGPSDVQTQVQQVVDAGMPATVDSRAQAWLDLHVRQEDGENFDSFIRAFGRETPEMQVAIEKRLAQNPPLTPAAVDLAANAQVGGFFTSMLRRMLAWWVYRR